MLSNVSKMPGKSISRSAFCKTMDQSLPRLKDQYAMIAMRGKACIACLTWSTKWNAAKSIF